MPNRDDALEASPPHSFASLRHGAPLALLLGMIGAASSGRATPEGMPATASSGGDSVLVGLIGPERISESELVQADQAAFDQLRSDLETQRHQLEYKYAKARHDLLRKRLDEKLDAAALDDEAKARGATTAAILADLKVNVPTEEETRAFYDQNRDRIREPYEQISSQVRQFLTDQRSQAAKRAFFDGLREKHGIKSLLGPYRVAVAATGPSRGPASAPVTIVEFGDFQCPYCKRAESSLQTILRQYPTGVRVVFRQLPLTAIHPDAEMAAEAAVCADRQGKFWEMHDALYADQTALSADGLKDTARRLGLKAPEFSACLGSDAAAALDTDLRAARDLGLSGTPYFFINGRPLDGNVPLDEFRRVVSEELSAGTSNHG